MEEVEETMWSYLEVNDQNPEINGIALKCVEFTVLLSFKGIPWEIKKDEDGKSTRQNLKISEWGKNHR